MDVSTLRFLTKELFKLLKNLILRKKRVIIVAGVARLLGWIGYFINLRRQIRNILGKETKNILREVFNMLKSVFVKRNIKCSLGEENIMTILSVFCRMDPEPIIRNEKAMAIVREAVLRSRLVITVFTIFATLLAEFYTVYVRIISLIDSRENGEIDCRKCKQEIKEVLISCVFCILSTSLTFFRRDYTNPLKIAPEVVAIYLMADALGIPIMNQCMRMYTRFHI